MQVRRNLSPLPSTQLTALCANTHPDSSALQEQSVVASPERENEAPHKGKIGSEIKPFMGPYIAGMFSNGSDWILGWNNRADRILRIGLESGSERNGYFSIGFILGSDWNGSDPCAHGPMGLWARTRSVTRSGTRSGSRSDTRYGTRSGTRPDLVRDLVPDPIPDLVPDQVPDLVPDFKDRIGTDRFSIWTGSERIL